MISLFRMSSLVMVSPKAMLIRSSTVLMKVDIIIMNSIYIALFHSGAECSKRFIDIDYNHTD